MRRKKIKEGEKIPVKLRRGDVKLIEGLTLFDRDYIDRLTSSPDSTVMLGYFTLDELDDLLGCVAADANHTENRRLEKQLDSLFARLRAIMESYDDGCWQNSAF